ncbi:hypothetical protein K435DRAFT_867294 [Dendrothele bispora CBS 962.96]|uniref:Uncharacterized protein n=1 Tax=Dendrothele bispora (strain CBS 962.96) TaxID=1314807 RepID=A0A4S8LEU7_DENBC|nr:hypothetical protein K435DRAFT_867294 [Dendrothele bispora CBS 962.96]
MSFVHMEMKCLNEERGPDQPRLKANKCAANIASKWQAMSVEERDTITTEAVKELNNSRENHHLATHNSSLSSFHDFQTTMDSVKLEPQRLNARMGTETIMIAVRSNVGHFYRPEVFASSNRPMDFINMAFKESVTDVAAQMEEYVLSGVEAEAAAEKG